jgi:uncharacterized membrane protein HdeD (DUF308 family)
MEQNKSNSYKVISIIALVLGICAFVFSFVPCLGTWAVFPGVIALVLGIIGFLQARKINAPKGLAIAGIILAFLGSTVAIWQMSAIDSAIKETDKALKESSVEMEKLEKDLEKTASETTTEDKAASE